MRLLSRKISLIVAPHGSTKSWTRVLPLTFLVGLAAALAGSIVLIVALFLRVLDLSGLQRESTALRQENANLREQLTGMHDLERELIRLQEFEVRFRRWAGLDLPGAAVASRTSPGLRNLDWEEEDLAQIPALPPVTGWMSRGFETGPSGHEGIDIAGTTGTPIAAAAAGVVQFAGWDETYGNVVVLDHENGFTSLYGHNDSLIVKTGQQVRRREVIAQLGNTGRSSAPHLHFEVRLNEHALDPAYLVSRDSLRS
jgi:murein DD-endopeptidase MepM/ murein hydrolase activator NlpD